MNHVKGITCFMFAFTFITVPLAKTFIHTMMGDLIDVYYDDMQTEFAKWDTQ